MTVVVFANPFNRESFDVGEPTPRYMTVSEDGRTYYVLVAMPPNPESLMCHCLFVGNDDRLEPYVITAFVTYEDGNELMFKVKTGFNGGSWLKAPSDYRRQPVLTVDGRPDEEQICLDPADFRLVNHGGHYTVEKRSAFVLRASLADLDAGVRTYQEARSHRGFDAAGADKACACLLMSASTSLVWAVEFDMPKRLDDDVEVPCWLATAMRRPIEAHRACDDPAERWSHSDVLAEAAMELLDAVGYRRPG